MGASLEREVDERISRRALFLEAVELIETAAREAVGKRGRFNLVLTGGRAARALYRHLVDFHIRPDFQEIWRRTDFFLGDERWVPEAHPDSNGGMVRCRLLDPCGIADDRIYLIPTPDSCDSPAEAAAAYEKTLRGYFGAETGGKIDLPQFDLVLLSLGDDGHVASLFPAADALREKESWVTVSSPPAAAAPAVARITLTLPVINRARKVVVMAVGGEKAALTREIVSQPPGISNIYPAAMVNSAGRTIWLLTDN
ncbi:MAG: 6-phosphogluconolactonase [Desulfurivibrionaceae bacterium]|nr:6-phosphogluconolactonase [Desulfobulbales bacterium]MDT8335112.1 6-phosphogluconolactonase [Desulfurivibrionaceae bacterium]